MVQRISGMLNKIPYHLNTTNNSPESKGVGGFIIMNTFLLQISIMFLKKLII